MVYGANYRLAKAAQRNPVSKPKKKKKMLWRVTNSLGKSL